MIILRFLTNTPVVCSERNIACVAVVQQDTDESENDLNSYKPLQQVFEDCHCHRLGTYTSG